MAVAVTEQVLEMAEGRDRALEGQVQHNLAMMSRATGHPHEALRLYEQALVIRREVRDHAGEGTTLNNLGSVYDDLGQKQQALDYYEQALLIRREVRDRAGEGTTLWNIGASYLEHQQYDVALACFLLAKEIYQQVQSPNADAVDRWITNLRERIGETEFASLLAQVEPQAYEIVEKALQEKTLSDKAEQPTSTMPAEQITTLVDNTVVVMTTMPERRAEWREAIAQAVQDARQRGADWQIEVEFFTAILTILDGQPPSLPAEHPYAAPIVAMQDVIAKGGPTPDGEDDVPEGVKQDNTPPRDTPDTAE